MSAKGCDTTEEDWAEYWKFQKILIDAINANDAEMRIAAIEQLDPKIHATTLDALLFFEKDPEVLMIIIKRIHTETDSYAFEK